MWRDKLLLCWNTFWHWAQLSCFFCNVILRGLIGDDGIELVVGKSLHADVFDVALVGGVFCMTMDRFLIGVDSSGFDGDVVGVVNVNLVGGVFCTGIDKSLIGVDGLGLAGVDGSGLVVIEGCLLGVLNVAVVVLDVFCFGITEGLIGDDSTAFVSSNDDDIFNTFLVHIGNFSCVIRDSGVDLVSMSGDRVD